jgi:AAA+ ATPase superfamily predicted ATPase
MKITKSELRKIIKEELLKEAEFTIPDEQGLEKEYNKIRRVFRMAKSGKFNKDLTDQVQNAAVEYKREIYEIEKVSAELDNWKRLLQNTQKLFYFMSRGGDLPAFEEMSDDPLDD